MREIPEPSSLRPDLPFKYIGGDLSLDLVNTVDWTAGGLVNERLTDYERLTRWAEGAGSLGRSDAQRLRREALARPRDAQAAWEEARLLRSVLQHLYAAIAAGERPGSAWEDFNQQLAATLRRLRVTPRSSRRAGPQVAEWSWPDAEEHLDSVLWPVVWSAAALLTSDEARRLRVCAGPDCGWIYVDRSRNRLRRWCEMETCGTAEKSRRRRERSERG